MARGRAGGGLGIAISLQLDLAQQEKFTTVLPRSMGSFCAD